MKLCQIVALVAGKKSRTDKAVTSAYHTLQKEDLLNGLSRTYSPKNEDGEQLPPEMKHVQVKAMDVLTEACKEWEDLFDLVASQDWANTKACADVTVDGVVLIEKAPVTYLMFLEHRLTDVRTMLDKLPTLDPAEQWEYDTNKDCFATDPKDSVRTKKEPRVITKAAATDKHPAQTELIYDDVAVGLWTRVLFSGKIPAQEKAAMLDRVGKVIDAVKVAREEANSIEAEMKKVAGPVFDYLLGE